MNENKRGWINGFLGVLIFSGSLPATRVAVADFAPLFLTCARATIAAVLGLGLLLVFQERRPVREEIFSLFIVALGVVIGFPLLTALALEHITAAYSTVFIGLLPLATAIFAVIRAGERPRAAFWLFSCVGSALVAGFVLTYGVNTSMLGNGYMIAAIIICGLGYAEGAKLSRTLGGWQTISWALILSLPAMAPLSYYTLPETFTGVGCAAWIGFVYVSVFSMLIGFVFWYRGLAQGGVAAVGQLQLLQPFLGFALAATLLSETVSGPMIAISLAVVVCVYGAKKFA